jgi:hypothetical protein
VGAGALALAVGGGCDRRDAPSPAATAAVSASAEFTRYWRAGKAEINRYELTQARYGRLHRGDAVLLFVTEDLRPDTQVKAESRASQARAVPVLKANLNREFATGIYRYSMLTSVFTPLDGTPTLKATTSAQDWCGHTWLQLNRRGGGYTVVAHSYFEDEADESFRLPGALLEDEIWNRIRLAPERLPTGEVQVVPSGFSARLRHRKPAAETALASLEPWPGGLRRYRLEHPASKRTLAIDFRSDFPHEIVAFEETYPDGQHGERLTTRAVRTHVVLEDYWRHHAPEDLPRRARLGLK